MHKKDITTKFIHERKKSKTIYDSMWFLKHDKYEEYNKFTPPPKKNSRFKFTHAADV